MVARATTRMFHACEERAGPSGRGVDATAATKAYLRGTHRLIAPRETVDNVRHLMPVMGITRIANVTGLDTIGIPVVMVSRPNSRSVSVSQGKGVDLDAAKASGLMESIEAYHAEHIVLPLKLGSVEELRYSHDLIDVSRMARHADSRFTAHTQLLWIEGRDLVAERDVWVPYEAVHLNYTLPLPSGHGCFAASSNGLASGNDLLEAISHGICEVIERDAVTLWHLLDETAQEETRIDLETVGDAACLELLARYHAAGVRVAAWNVTSDVGVPAFLCRIVEDTPPPYNGIRPACGMGCHPSSEIALARALAEAAQSRLTFISGARDDLWRAEYQAFLDPRTHANWLRRIDAEGDGEDFRRIGSHRGETLADDIAWELERLRAVGIEEVVVVDLTRPEFGVAVARVIVPGLEGIDGSPRFAPGERARARLT